MEHQVSREFLLENLTNPIDLVLKQKCWNYAIKQLINSKAPQLQKEDLLPFLTMETCKERENALLREAENVTAENMDKFLAVNRKFNGKDPQRTILHAFEIATDPEIQIALCDKLLHRKTDLEQLVIIALLKKGNQYFFDKALSRIRYKPVYTSYLGDLWKAFASLPLTEIQQEQFLRKTISGTQQNFADVIHLVNKLRIPHEGILELGIRKFNPAYSWNIEETEAIASLLSREDIKLHYKLFVIRRIFITLGNLTQKEDALRPLADIYIAEIKNYQLYLEAIGSLRKMTANPQSRGIFLEIVHAVLEPIIASRNKDLLTSLWQIIMQSINKNILPARVTGMLELGKKISALTANYGYEISYQNYGTEIIKETVKIAVIDTEQLKAVLAFVKEKPYYLANIFRCIDWRKPMLTKEIFCMIKKLYPYNPKEVIKSIERLLNCEWIDSSFRYFIEQNLLEPLKVHTIKTPLPLKVAQSVIEIKERLQIQKFLDE